MKDDLLAAFHLPERRLRKASEFQHLFVAMAPVINQEEEGPACPACRRHSSQKALESPELLNTKAFCPLR